MENKAQNFWDKQASRYDSAETQFEKVYSEIFARTEKYLNSEDHLLDFGCATGSKTLQLVGMVKQAHGLDYSPEMIAEAIKKKEKELVPNVTFTSGTIFSEEFGAESFDKVVAYSVLHLLEDEKEVVGRIHRLLKPGGLFISATPCFRERMNVAKRLQFSLVFLMKSTGLFPLQLNKYHRKDLEELVVGQGFQLVASEMIFHEMSIGFLVARK